MYLAGIVFFSMIGSHCYSGSFQELHISKTMQIMNHDNVPIVFVSYSQKWY